MTTSAPTQNGTHSHRRVYVAANIERVVAQLFAYGPFLQRSTLSIGSLLVRSTSDSNRATLTGRPVELWETFVSQRTVTCPHRLSRKHVECASLHGDAWLWRCWL